KKADEHERPAAALWGHGPYKGKRGVLPVLGFLFGGRHRLRGAGVRSEIRGFLGFGASALLYFDHDRALLICAAIIVSYGAEPRNAAAHEQNSRILLNAENPRDIRPDCQFCPFKG